MSILSEEQISEFERSGLLRLGEVFSEADAALMRDSLWVALAKEHGIRPDDPATWTIRQPTGFQSLTRQGAFDRIANPALVSTMDGILGEGEWDRPKHWGTPLVTFPHFDRRWDVPCAMWHLDFAPREPSRPLPGVRILAYIGVVEPGSGGTVALAGSHSLVERWLETEADCPRNSASMRDALARRHPWLHDLWSGDPSEDRAQRFMNVGVRLDGTDLRVVELTGAPGDVILMHPWTFHAPAPHCGRTPRMMVSHSIFRQRIGQGMDENAV
jgi:hypothetical protein